MYMESNLVFKLSLEVLEFEKMAKTRIEGFKN
jgi:hypothetical protein